MLNSVFGTLSSGVTVAASSFESISTYIATGGETTITLGSIPNTFKHLQLRCISKDTYTASDGTQESAIRFNGDTGSNYAGHRIRGNGSTVASGGSGSVTVMDRSLLNVYGNLPNIFAVTIIDVLDYASTTKNKTIKSISGGDINNTGGQITLGSGLWMSTSAVTSIAISGWISGCAAGSIFALYGIKGS